MTDDWFLGDSLADWAANHQSPITNHQSPIINPPIINESPITNHQSSMNPQSAIINRQ
jgi:hypothetical protein